MPIKWTDTDAVKYKRILLCGPSKTGKTYFAGSFPKPIIINTDKGTATLSDLHAPYFDIEWPTAKNKSRPWLEVRKILKSMQNREGSYWDELVEAGYEPETVVLDSISALSDMMEEEIILYPPDGKEREETLWISDYNIIGRRLLGIVDLAKELPYNFIATAGVDRVKDDVGAILEAPMASGNKLGPRIPHAFDDVYLTEMVGGDKEDAFWSLTPLQSKRFNFSGSRLGLPMKKFKNPTYEKLRKYYEGKEK